MQLSCHFFSFLCLFLALISVSTSFKLTDSLWFVMCSMYCKNTLNLNGIGVFWLCPQIILKSEEYECIHRKTVSISRSDELWTRIVVQKTWFIKTAGKREMFYFTLNCAQRKRARSATWHGQINDETEWLQAKGAYCEECHCFYSGCQYGKIYMYFIYCSS